MSRSVRFEIPSPSTETRVKYDGPFIDALVAVFGPLPINLNYGDLRELRVLKATNPDESGWTRLMELIEEHQYIEVKVDY